MDAQNHRIDQKHMMGELADDCAMHLKCEEQALKEMVDVLQAVRSALRSGDNVKLAEAANAQDKRAQVLNDIRDLRTTLRNSIATALGIPEGEATVRKLIDSVPMAMQDKLNEQRNRVADLAREAERLMQGNLLVVLHGMQVLQQIMTCLTGDEPSETTYASTGRPAAQRPSVVFQTKC